MAKDKTAVSHGPIQTDAVKRLIELSNELQKAATELQRVVDELRESANDGKVS